MKVKIEDLIAHLEQQKRVLIQPSKRNHFDVVQNARIMAIDDLIVHFKRISLKEIPFLCFHADSVLDEVAENAELDPSEHVSILRLQNDIVNTVEIVYSLEQKMFQAPKLRFNVKKLNALLVNFAKRMKNV